MNGALMYIPFRRQAFTLLEMSVAIAILATVTTMVGQSISMGAKMQPRYKCSVRSVFMRVPTVKS